MLDQAILSGLKEVDNEVFDLVVSEETRQQRQIRLIPSENYASCAVRAALATSFTNKYGEGYPGRRYYQGQVNTDKIENLAIERAKQLFGYPFANVQALSGAPANLAVYTAFLKPFAGKIMAMRLDHGGHLTHGSPVSVTGAWFEISHYGCQEDDYLDMEKIRAQALEFRPDVLVCGYTAYPRTIDFKAFGEIAREVGAISLADISHIAGLIAGGSHPSPFPHMDVVTFTTHKTLRGPRAAIILSKDPEHADKIDKAVFPGLQGGPHFNTISAIAVALKEALSPAFKSYTDQVVKNAISVADELKGRGYHIISGGTDNHLVLVDVRKSCNLPGKRVAEALEDVGIVCNFNTVPNASDRQKPLFPDGIRLGTPSITTRGFKENDCRKVAELMDRTMKNIKAGKLEKGESPFIDEAIKDQIAAEVAELATSFPTFSWQE
ncbi:serine hydroxymethyltransferase [Myxococcota bacterium]|nr:serine hydroxymethyltransferase [Myxococcota bacterium]MBU1382711.1 serine hydroxymethyltransferase [Myxococcota bacterium]MBU1496007.1 serine hydroxymethyltransferase [Myxococcota bacterium]